MSQVQFDGSWFSTMGQAARAWADTALPDTNAIGSDEDAEQAAEGLEAFWWGEAQKIGEGAPEVVGEEEWRAACRAALVSRIGQARADAYHRRLAEERDRSNALDAELSGH